LAAIVSNIMERIFMKIEFGTRRLKEGFARMQKGGVIMDVVTPEQAKIAEKAGAVAVMALHAVPADIRATGGVARMADPETIKKIIDAITIPVMAKCRIGHFAEAQILEALGVDMIDESEVLTPADEQNHIDKKKFIVPFVCGARDLGEALRRINEGAAMIRTKGEPGTGNIVEAVRHIRKIKEQIAELSLPGKNNTTLEKKAAELRVPIELLLKTTQLGRVPVVNFAAGGIASPADAALMMQLGADGVFVGSGIFKSSNPERYAKAIVEATKHYDDPQTLLKISKGLGEAMKGIDMCSLTKEQRMQERGL
jgi:pyridoxal 5'-phosphate synthase pdxS subunit